MALFSCGCCMGRRQFLAGGLAAATALASVLAWISRWVPSAVLPTPGWDSGAVLPHSHRCSAPKAAAERTMEPTLNGCPTESSSSASRASLTRRHSRLSRLTSTGRS